MAESQKNPVRVVRHGRLQEGGKSDRLPVRDRNLVAFAGSPLGFLQRPAHFLPQKAAAMITVELNVEVTPNNFGDALGGPEVVRPAVSPDSDS